MFLSIKVCTTENNTINYEEVYREIKKKYITIIFFIAH